MATEAVSFQLSAVSFKGQLSHASPKKTGREKFLIFISKGLQAFSKPISGVNFH